MSEPSGRSRALSRPGWGGLYAAASLMLAGLGVAEIVVAPGAELIALECGIVVAGFGAMVGWTRRNRAALDRLDWCACAGARMTVRVIPSHRRDRERVMVRDVSVPVERQAPVEVELEEVAR